MKTILTLTILLSLTACTTGQKIWLWEKVEQATRDDEPAPPPVVEPAPTPAPPAPAPCRTWETPPDTMRGGGVWKPVAESGGKLVILINTRFRGHVEKLELLRVGTWEILERGRFDGDTHNGCRPHYRFAHPGAHYGRDIMIRVTLQDGTERAHVIADGSQRADW